MNSQTSLKTSQGGGVATPSTLPLDPPLITCSYSKLNCSDNLTLQFPLDRLAVIALVLARIPFRIGILLTHNNGDFGAISETEQSCAALTSKVERHISAKKRKEGRPILYVG